MNNRVNFSLILISLILINFKILLINEESLILICFSAFCFLSSTRLSSTVESFFKTQTDTLKSELISSSSKLISTTKQKKSNLQTKLVWPSIFSELKLDVYNFNVFILSQFSLFYQTELQNQLQKKLEFSLRLESQLTKILVLIITQKLQNSVKLQNFYQGILKVNTFKTIKTIYFREHLQKIVK